MELLAVEHRQVEEGQVDGVREGEIDPLEDFFAGAGADGAHEVEEPVAEEQRTRVRHLDAVLQVEEAKMSYSLNFLLSYRLNEAGTNFFIGTGISNSTTTRQIL